MSRTFFIALAILLSPASVRADVAGCWISAAGNSVIEMHVENDVVTGRIVGMNDPVFLAEEGRGTPGAVRTDLENPEPALRERPLAGLVILENLQRDGRRWDNGSVYDPESGKSYSVRAEVDGDGLLLLRGYIGSPLFGRTTKWSDTDASPDDTARMLERTRPYLPEGAPTPRCAP